MSAETPDLFPGLTADDRAKLARLAETMETVPEIVERMNGYLLDLSKQRAVTPAVVDSFPISGRQRYPLVKDTAVPLTVDDMGRLMTSLPRRRIEIDLAISIPPGGTVSDWMHVADNALDHCVQVALWDDRSRLAAEVITVQGAFKDSQPDPAAGSLDAYTLSTNILAATIGVIGTISSNIQVCRWVRLISAVAVGPEGRSFRITRNVQ